MILEAFYNIVLVLVLGLLNILPSTDILPSGFQNAWNWASDFLSNLFYVIPSGTQLLTIFYLVILVESGIFTFQVINWIINKIRGSG